MNRLLPVRFLFRGRFLCLYAGEDEIPEFSLDDILKTRDEEFAQTAAASEETAPLFPDLNLWDDEPESADDATIVIERPVK